MARPLLQGCMWGTSWRGLLQRFKVTFAAGMIATIAGVFPAFAWKLLGFVGLYGTILAPMGGILFFDWYVKRKQNVDAFHAAQPASSFNVAVLLAWLIPVGTAVYCIKFMGISAWYCPLPCWIACGLLYLLLSGRSTSSTSA